MKFQPRSEEEVKRLFDKGDYPFTVGNAIEKKSKNGNPMIELHLHLHHTVFVGKTGFAKCYLLTDQPNFEFLLRHFCYSVGLWEDYEKGNLDATRLINKKGIVRIGIEVDDSGKYPDKNKVIDFISQTLEGDAQSTSLNDDIPF